jgi:catechol 2,3-dioxygenase-like lactoylglutathione lyase family enzyme
MDHVSVVVDDLEAGKVFFVDLDMELEGHAPGSEENGLIESTGSMASVSTSRLCEPPTVAADSS